MNHAGVFGTEVLNQRGTPAFFEDTLANRPAPGIPGRLFVATDTLVFQRDTGTAWDTISPPTSGFVINYGGTPGILEDLAANRPAPGTAGRLFISTDTLTFQRDTGAAWQTISNTANFYANGVNAFGSTPSITASTTAGALWSLSSTNHATKGKILLGAVSAFDEANTKLGLGTVNPNNLTIPGVTLTLAPVIQMVSPNTAQVGSIASSNSTNQSGYAISSGSNTDIFIDAYQGDSNSLGFVFGGNIRSNTRFTIGTLRPSGFGLNSTNLYASLPNGMSGTISDGTTVFVCQNHDTSKDGALMVRTDDNTRGVDLWNSFANGTVFLDSLYDNSASLLKIRMRSKNATPVVAITIAATGDTTFVGNVILDGGTGKVVKYTNSVAAPGTTATPAFTNYYGGNTNALGDPVGWITINVAGTNRKVPFY